MPTASLVEPQAWRVTLEVSQEIIDCYERIARNRGQSLESFLSKKLRETISQDSARPIYLSDSDRQSLEKILHMTLDSSKALIDEIRKMALVKVGAIEVNLPEKVVARLRSRCPKPEPFERYLKRVVLQGIEQYVGLR